MTYLTPYIVYIDWVIQDKEMAFGDITKQNGLSHVKPQSHSHYLLNIYKTKKQKGITFYFIKLFKICQQIEGQRRKRDLPANNQNKYIY